ncbi:Rax1 protein [Maudiozyma humilis]|uniref:Rax1 protein n=1 Tax=Maudiozyma humilis TaxID=51915 RepID=A0AAV5S3Z3_MAUHU|nr:Rax1 protein [Kazachstania humilis]
MEDDFERIQNERLPTLYEVLIQKTKPPLDLWSFYTYLSQFPYAINYLDFWVDLMAHIRLCKDYVKLVHESVILEHHASVVNNEKTEGHHNGDTEVDNDLNQHSSTNSESDNVSVTTSVLLNALLEDGKIDLENTQGMANFLQGEQAGNNNTTNYSPKIAELIDGWKRHSNVPHDALNIENPNLAVLMDEILKKHPEGLPLPHISTDDLLSNAVRICDMYLLSPIESEHYLSNIPEDIRQKIVNQVKVHQSYIPDVFDELKTLTYQFLETDCFPKFLSRIALHNIHDEISDWRFRQDVEEAPVAGTSHVPHRTNRNKNISSIRYQGTRSPFSNYTSLSRTIFGLLWLGIGFWIGYTLIFLKYSRAIRVTTVVPFAIGSYMIVCGLYQVDILYSWFGVTQRLMYRDNDSDNTGSDRNLTNGDKTAEKQRTGNSETNVSFIFALLGGRNRLIKVEHPFTRALLFKRGLWCCMLAIISTACFTIIFSCVPGYRI